MGDLDPRNLFALTPAGGMGMGDKAVRAGRFDQPGMPAMGAMPAMPGMDHAMGHGPATTEERMPAMAPPDGHHPPGPEPGQHHAAPPPPDPDHAGHGSAKAAAVSAKESLPGRSARPFGTDFRPLAADVASAPSLALDGMDPRRPWPPYQQLRATTSTAFDPARPVREIRLTLDGDMERYVWFLNNKALSESDVIAVRRGEVVRFIMINRTMMHHPMHLHGHFFRVVNGQGDRAPLKHTVDVAPMSTTVIEFDANEVGDWFFHCHLLYHMESGMARLVHYDGFAPPPAVAAIRSRLYRDHWYFWGEAAVLSNMSEGFLKAANTRNTLRAEWESGWEGVERHQWEGLVLGELYLNRFFSAFAGLDLLGAGSETEESRGVVGLTWLLPLNIESRFWLDSDGGTRFSFEKVFAITPRFALTVEAEYDSHRSEWEEQCQLSYLLNRDISLLGRWHSDFGWGGGMAYRF
jgi:hypothetical protein